MPRPFGGDWNGRIELVILPHCEQRYDTCGDWSFTYYPDEDGATLTYSISETSDQRMNFALFKHELNESLLFLFKNGFTKQSVEKVDAWDKGFIESSGAEPGEDSLAPYFAEHMFASAVEYLVAAQIGLDWNDYTDTVGALEYFPKKENE